jgi:hypothetical protein
VMFTGRGGGYILVRAEVGIYLGIYLYFYEEYVFIIMLNMALYISVKVSFICNLCLHKLCMWNCSSVFSDWPSFQCLVFLMFGRLCHMCVLCRVYVGRILRSVCLFWCPEHPTSNVRPVCSTSLSGHSLYFNWFTPLWFYIYCYLPWF